MTELENWKEKFPYRSRDELIEYGKSIGRPGFEYYEKLFKEESGDLFKLRQRGLSCRLFDPFFLKGKEREIEGLELITDELTSFEYEQFDNEFIARLKK